MRTRNQEKREVEKQELVENSEEAQPGRNKTPKRQRKSVSEASIEASDAVEVASLTPGDKKRKTTKQQVEATGSQELGASVGDDAALAVPEAGAEEGSEDEAPEELSLAGGKLAAEKQVQEEKKERAEGRKTTKQKRRRSAASDEGLAGDEDPQAVAEEDLDELSPEIIAALQRQAAEEALQAAQASSGGRTSLNAGAELLESEKVPYRRDGPVLVRILGDTARPSFNPSESAKEYAKQRLYGARLKRSTTMLQPVGRSKIQI